MRWSRGLILLAPVFVAGLVGGSAGGCREGAKVPQVAPRPVTIAAPVAANMTPPATVNPPRVDYITPPGKGTKGRHFATLQKSKLRLSAVEAKMLDGTGVVISTGKRFPTFAHGYVDIYVNDLPVFVSADSILD